MRHGRSILNEHKRLQPWTPEGDILSPSGRIQAQLLARILRFLDFSSIYSSDFLRVEETARLILHHQKTPRGLQLRTDVSLRDFNFGKLVGLSVRPDHNEMAVQFPQIHELYAHDTAQFYAPDGDRLSEFSSRASTRLAEIADASIGKVVGIVTHDFWIRSALFSAWQRPLSDFLEMRIRNASISIVEYHRQSHTFDVLVANDVAHLS
jgi:broad specificity phosphatase PhoE